MLIFVLVTAMFVAVSLSKPVKAANWQQVTVISGSGSQTAGEFMVNGSEWRIRWSFARNAQYPSSTAFSFFVYPHGETNVYKDSVIKYGGDENSGTLSLQGTGLHYIEIVVANTPGYTLNVEYNADSVVSDSTLVLVIALTIGVPIVLIVIISVIVRKRVKRRKLLAAPFAPPPPPPPPP
jgi:hypothetical protein